MLPGLPANTFSRGRAYRAQGSSCRGRTGRSLDLGLQEDGRRGIPGSAGCRWNRDGHDSHTDSRRRDPDHNGCGPKGQDGFREDHDPDGVGKEKEVTHIPGASASGEVRFRAPSEMAGPFFFWRITNGELRTYDYRARANGGGGGGG